MPSKELGIQAQVAPQKRGCRSVFLTWTNAIAS